MPGQQQQPLHGQQQGGWRPSPEAWERLNEEQRRAAMTDRDSPLMILAGAGTGKTTTLVARIEFLVNQVR